MTTCGRLSATQESLPFPWCQGGVVTVVIDEMFIRAALGIAGGAFVLLFGVTAADDHADSGEAGLLGIVALVFLVLAGAPLACAAMLPRRLSCIRFVIAIVIVEPIAVLNGLVNFVSARSIGLFQPLGLFPVIRGALVIRPFARQEAKVRRQEKSLLSQYPPHGNYCMTPLTGHDVGGSAGNQRCGLAGVRLASMPHRRQRAGWPVAEREDQ